MNSHPSNFPGEVQAGWSSVILCDGLIISCCLERWAAKRQDGCLNVVFERKGRESAGSKYVLCPKWQEVTCCILWSICTPVQPLHGWMEQRVGRDGTNMGRTTAVGAQHLWSLLETRLSSSATCVGARGDGLCNQISSVCRVWVQILWKELLGKQDPLLVYQLLASESISWLLQSPRKGFPHPALAATSPPLSLMHIVPLACGAEAVARESKLSPHVGPSVVAAVTRRRELGPSARSCRESLGRSTDLESLFSLLLIISLLCPPTGVPLLNSCPDS